jgi:integrase
MKSQFILFRRSGVFYSEDTVTGKQTSLRTKIKSEALVILNAKNESARQPNLNLQLARAYLSASDPEATQRTWQDVMDEMESHGKPATKTRCACAMRSKAFDSIRALILIQTKAEQIRAILEDCTVSTAHYLKRLHNLAYGLGWLPSPVLPPKQWPKLHFKAKRGITAEEHERIVAAEKNVERKFYYQLLWEVGASQSDAAALAAANVDWKKQSLRYNRMKTGTTAQVAIGKNLRELLKELPSSGPLFPKISTSSDNARASEFSRRCRLLGIQGVSLHSYRYAWAERAKSAGYPERFAMENLGHNSKAVHRAYAKSAEVTVPALDDFERQSAERKLLNVIPIQSAQAA